MVILSLRRRICRKVEARVSSVTDRTDKAERGFAKGIHAEERYLLIDVLSGRIVNSCTAVTGDISEILFLRWSATDVKLVNIAVSMFVFEGVVSVRTY